MGTVCSSIFNKSYVHYQFTDKVISHPVIGQLMVIQDDVTGNLLYGFQVNLETLALRDQALLERHQLLTHSNILRFEGFKKLNNTDYVVLYESFECTFEEEIQKRKAKKKPFSEQEILGILQNITAALTYFQNKDIYHGQVTSETIVKKSDEYKLLDLVLFEKNLTTYEQALQNHQESKSNLLSPELKEALSQQLPSPNCKKYKQDIYTLGIIILDAMNLDLGPGYTISERLAQAMRLYSEFLIEVVTKMVQESELLRIDAATCNKIVENMYYGFTVTENSERGPFPSSRENQAEIASPPQLDYESPTKEDLMRLMGGDNYGIGKTNLEKLGSDINKDYAYYTKDSIQTSYPLFNSIEIREGVSLQERLPSVVHTIEVPQDSHAHELRKNHGQYDTYKKLRDPLDTESCFVNHGTTSSVTEQFYKDLLHKEDPIMRTAYSKGIDYNSKISASYAPDERVHTFGSTHRAADEYMLSENSKMLSVQQNDLKYQPQAVTPFLQIGIDDLSKPPTVQQTEAKPLRDYSDFLNHKDLKTVASLTAENFSTKDTLENGRSNFENSEDPMSFQERRAQVKRRNQAVLISDSYQDTGYPNYLSGVGESQELGANGSEISSSLFFKSPTQIKRKFSQPTNIMTIEEYQANEIPLSEAKEASPFKADFSTLKHDEFNKIHRGNLIGSSTSSLLESELKFINGGASEEKLKKHQRTRTMNLDIGGLGRKGSRILSQDFGTGFHSRLKTCLSESLYKPVEGTLQASQIGTLHRSRRNDMGRSTGYALEHLRNDMKHSFFADTENFLEKRIGPQKKRTNSTIESLHQTIKRIRTSDSMAGMKLSIVPYEFQQTGLMDQVLGETKKSLNIVLPQPNRMMHSRHTSEIYEDNSRYEGEMQGDLRHGQGKLRFKDGRFYEGAWKLGRIDGYGILYCSSGVKIYEGEWKNNNYEGSGTIYNEQPIGLDDDYIKREFSREEGTWVRYEGEFINNKWNGFGKLVLSNGDIIQGIFRQDKLHGKGSYNKSDGMIIAGEWHNNVLVKAF